MNRWSLGVAAAVGLVSGTMGVARAQDFFVYEAQPVYSTQVVVPARSVVTTVYAAPVVVRQPIAQMSYSTSVIVPARTVVTAPVVLARPTTVVETTRVSRHNYTQTVRVNGPTDGPRYSRVHVHSGLFGTTVRERVR